MAVLHNSSLDSLLNRAREEEKRYEWLQAAKLHQKASNLVLKDNDFSKAAAFTGRIGFCFCRAAFQAQTNVEFKERLKLAIQAYEKEIRILEKSKEENKHAKIKQAKALATYVRSWLETSVPQKKELLDEWWTLENQVLEAYESIGDLHSVGVVCTDMIEFSLYARLWLSNHSEEVRLEEEALRLAEKAIEALSKSEDDYELARAYCFASVWYSSQSHASPEFRDKRPQLVERGRDFSKKALELSSKTHDAWLIGFAYYSASTAAIWYDWNFTEAAEYGQKTQEYGSIAKDQLLLTYGTYNTAYPMTIMGEFLEDPDKQRITFEKARKLAQECVQVSRIINHMTNVCWGYFYELSALTWLAAIEADQRIRQKTLENAIKIAREGLEVTAEWKRLSANLHMSLGDSLRLLSAIRNDVEEKRALLLEAQSHQEKSIEIHEEFVPFLYSMLSWARYNFGLVQIELAILEIDKAGKAKLLDKAAKTLENSRELLARWIIQHPENVQMTQVWGRHCDRLGRVLQQIYYLTKEEKQLSRAIEAHRESATAFNRGELPAHAAESYWYIAQLQGQIGEHQEASKNYESAAQAYDTSLRKDSPAERLLQ